MLGIMGFAIYGCVAYNSKNINQDLIASLVGLVAVVLFSYSLV